MELQILCPRCRGPMQSVTLVDRGDYPEEIPLDPVVFQKHACTKCGYTRTIILPGLPSDEEGYLEWKINEITRPLAELLGDTASGSAT